MTLRKTTTSPGRQQSHKFLHLMADISTSAREMGDTPERPRFHQRRIQGCGASVIRPIIQGSARSIIFCQSAKFFFSMLTRMKIFRQWDSLKDWIFTESEMWSTSPFSQGIWNSDAPRENIKQVKTPANICGNWPYGIWKMEEIPSGTQGGRPATLGHVQKRVCFNS
ncbi:uncharacterized protein YALI1_B17299t [Yarrowia lipolytica]|uniref:Uncharacterized protein n=1 Tax=Yarrowia lipolytica TaxID=4952 RepID=A0A1D8N7L8_YARLL|nr:hypothetical protein YALI1_B17299t [Yarrowia lipolytica]